MSPVCGPFNQLDLCNSPPFHNSRALLHLFPGHVSVHRFTGQVSPWSKLRTPCDLTWSRIILLDIRNSRSAMDPGDIQCSCGRTFAQLNAYTNHQRTCKKRKKGLSSALAKAKLVWDDRKRRRTTSGNVGEHVSSSGAMRGVPDPRDVHDDGHQLQENNCQIVSPLCSIRWTACS